MDSSSSLVAVVITWALVYSLFALIGGLLGRSKGRTFEGALLGTLLGPVGLVIAWLVLTEKQPEHRSPRITSDEVPTMPGGSGEHSRSSGT